MELKIAHRIFKSEEVRCITIRERKVLVDTTDDFYQIPYKNESEIRDAFLWKRLQELTLKDVQDAVEVLICICDSFINTKSQCIGCPLHNINGCMLQKIPMDWKG